MASVLIAGGYSAPEVAKDFCHFSPAVTPSYYARAFAEVPVRAIGTVADVFMGSA